MERIAIIGSGIAGMACAHCLKDDYEITLFEKNDYAGGHTNTVSVIEGERTVPIDTGFMVFNRPNYPNLIKLFETLNVPIKETSMSFSVQHVPTGLEYSGSGLNGLFAQRKNMFSPKHIRMLMQIGRFNKQSVEDMQNGKFQDYTVAQYIRERGYGEDMLYKYLLPMSSALWSTPTDVTMKFPAAALIRFFQNHGFLGLNTQHTWYTVDGGSREYRDRLIAPFKHAIHMSEGVVSVTQHERGATVSTFSGQQYDFDKVICASHADDTLGLLINATDRQRDVLCRFQYQKNTATLHTDQRVMPRTRSTWSSWNYRIEERTGCLQPSCIYYMNSLQGVSDKKDYFVSINDPGNVSAEKILRMISYEHPVFTLDAMKAQPQLPSLNEEGPVYFCGSYFRYGFHEDAFTSAVELCKQLLGPTHPAVKPYSAPLFDQQTTIAWS